MFFTFSPAELKLIEARRGAALELGLALHIGFLRMSGRLLNAFRVVLSLGNFVKELIDHLRPLPPLGGQVNASRPHIGVAQSRLNELHRRVPVRIHGAESVTQPVRRR